MNPTTAKQLRKVLRDVPRSEWPDISAKAHVPLSTLQKIAYGVTGSPSFDAGNSIVRALEARQRRIESPPKRYGAGPRP